MNELKLTSLLQQWFIEDIGEGDLTSESIFAVDDRGCGQFLAKDSGVIAGISIIKKGYELLHPEIEVQLHVQDGLWIEKGQVLATVCGPIRYLLTGERVILNLIQHLSGIATMTHLAVKNLNSNHTRVCDTRKTTPGLRMLEKYAVRCGGGFNHRLGLYDGVMIKDNHIAHMGSILQAVAKVKEKLGHMVKVEVEIETKEELLEAIEAKADVILLDNLPPDKVKEFVALIPDYIITEASGGITISNIADYSHTGVNYISLGALTHSVTSLDISFNIIGGKKA